MVTAGVSAAKRYTLDEGDEEREGAATPEGEGRRFHMLGSFVEAGSA